MIALNATRSNCSLVKKTLANQFEALKLNRRCKSNLSWKISDSLNNNANATIGSKLQLVESKIPTLSSPYDVLVKVHSTSINPLDVRMVYGYGRRVLDLLHMATNHEPSVTQDRYPLTLGRDFSGEVVATGPYAREYKSGDLVFGAVEPQRSGAHSQYVSVPSYCLTKKPSNVTHEEAASIPFVALTAYSALCTFGNLSRSNCVGKQVLVLGGSGGVGSFAIQLLKFWGANVVATCSEQNCEWLENTLFVDRAVNYNDPSQMESLHGRFNFILDCANYDKSSNTRQDVVDNCLKYLSPFKQAIYVTLSPPILDNVDRHGIVFGSVETLLDAFNDTLKGLMNLNSARWAVFLPNKMALNYLASLYEEEAIVPLVSHVFSFAQTPQAFEKLESGRVRGKVVVDVSKMELDHHGSPNSSVKRATSAD